MPFWVKSVCFLSVGLLAGCASGPRPNTSHVPDWEQLASESPAPVAPHPAPAAAPPAAVPVEPVQPPSPAPRRVPAAQPSQTWVEMQSWCQANGWPALVRLTGGAVPVFELRAPAGVLQLRPGTPVVQWDGLELHLGLAPQLHNGQLYLHALDLKKTIEPLLIEAATPPLGANPVIVIDPGHGGENAGTRSVLGEYYEKEFTLDWARRLEALLGARGWQVFLTRESDEDLALSNRVNFAEAHQADLFLSLHFNSAAPSQTESGLETYCLTPVGLPSSLTRGYADDAAAAFPNNAFDAENLQLALRVHRALLQVNGHHDRGVRRARFPGVLRGQQRPAILVEGGYLSNPREARLIAEPTYRQQLAQAIATALTETGPNVAGGWSNHAKVAAADGQASVPAWEEGRSGGAQVGKPAIQHAGRPGLQAHSALQGEAVVAPLHPSTGTPTVAPDAESVPSHSPEDP